MNGSKRILFALALAALNLIAFIVSISSHDSWFVTLITLITTIILGAYIYPQLFGKENLAPDE